MKLRYLTVLALCCGCFPDKAVVDPYSYAPKSPNVIWRSRQTLGEPVAVPEGDTPLSLAEVLDIALRNNPNTKLSWAKARVAAAQYGQSQSYQFPTLTGSYTYQRTRGLTATATTPDAVTGEADDGVTAQKYYLSQWGPQAQLSYILFDFGQHRATSNAAKEALHFADYTHNRQIQTVLQQATSDYYNLLYQKELFKANEIDLHTAEITFDATKLELDAGTKDLSDFLQAQTQLLQSQVQLITQRQNVVNSLAALLTDMGLKANQKVEFQEVPDIPPTDEMIQSADDLLAIAMQKRSDLLAAEANLKSQEENVSAARRRFLPTFQYNLNFGQTSYTTLGSDNYDFVSTFSMTFPIFTGFSNLNNLRMAKAQKEQAEATVRQTQLQVVQDITTTHSSVKTAFEALKYADALLQTTEKQYDVALARYKAGTGNILELIAAQSSLADARASVANATNQWFTSLVELSYAAGTLELASIAEAQ